MDNGTSLSWQVGTRHLVLTRPLVMGILNLTPDSFYDGGKYYPETAQAMAVGARMVEEGADIIDLGGESSRPGAEPVTAVEELKRVLPVLQALRAHYPKLLLSVDTTKAEVAKETLQAGANIINDISAGRFDPDLFSVLAEASAGYVLMHMQGTPRTMQMNPSYHNVVVEVSEFLGSKLNELEQAGITRKQVVLDPGIGFGKKLEHNIALLRSVKEFKRWGRPLLYGVSRKSLFGQLLGRELEERLPATIATNMYLLLSGVNILRVHDVAPAVDAVKLYLALREEEATSLG